MDTKFHLLPKVLAISPGGIRGFYELGYLHTLEKNQILSQVDTYIGVSVGAIISLFLTCGYKVDEIVNIAIISDMLSMACFTSLSSVWYNKGILSTDKIEQTLKEYVEAKFFHIPTYKTLFEITGKTLCTVAVELKDDEVNRVRYFDPISTPDMSCVEGVMLSIIIPFIMYAREYENNRYIDGAIGNPYPVDQYDDGETPILGVSISTLYRQEDEEDGNLFTQMMNHIVHLLQVFDGFMECHKKRIFDSCSDKVIHMNICDDSLDFVGITKGEREKAIMLMKGMVLAESDIKNIKWVKNKNTIRYEPRKRIIKKNSVVVKTRDDFDIGY